MNALTVSISLFRVLKLKTIEICKMSQRNEHIDLLLEELERYGLKGQVSDRGKHLEVAWEAPLGRRFVIAARTPSDWRTGLNTRSDLRRLLKADNLQPKQINELTFQRAMQLPKAREITNEQILQKDVDVLTDLVFELQSTVAALQEQNIALAERMNSITVVSKIELGSPNQDPVEGPIKLYNGTGAPHKETKTSMVLNMLTAQFSPVSDLIRRSGLTRAHVNTILQKAKNAGLVENGLRGQWRKIA